MHRPAVTPLITALAVLVGGASTLEPKGQEPRAAHASGRVVSQPTMAERRAQAAARARAATLAPTAQGAAVAFRTAASPFERR